jgi:hypothetical protein
VGIGHLDGEALEELLVDRVQEVLLLREIVNGGSGGLNGPIETIQRLQEIVKFYKV